MDYIKILQENTTSEQAQYYQDKFKETYERVDYSEASKLANYYAYKLCMYLFDDFPRDSDLTMELSSYERMCISELAQIACAFYKYGEETQRLSYF